MPGNVTINRHQNNSDIWLRLIAFNSTYECVDPDSITLVITLPDASTVTKTMVDMEQWEEPDIPGTTGHWRYMYRPTAVGFYSFVFTFTVGSVQGVEPGYFRVV